MTDAPEVIVVGGGHNGLVCAAYLARAGRRVTLLEARSAPGGAAATHEFHPGFRVSSMAHLLQGLDAQVMRELDLERHGLAWAQRDLHTLALHADAAPLELHADGTLVGPVAEREREAYQRFAVARARFASVLADWHARTPPRLRFGGWRDAWPAARLAWSVRRLGRRDMRELLRVATMSIQDWLQEHFDDPRLQGALALDAVLGTRAGPRSGGTVFTTLHRVASGAAPSVPVGGMGAVTAALRLAAESAGVTLRLEAPVAAFEVEQGQVTGVRLEGGETLRAGAVVSALDPKRTLLGLLGARHLEAEFARRVQHVRAVGTAAKLHLALRGEPRFQGVDPRALGQRLVIAPDPDYVDRAFNPAKYREFSAQPVMEIHIPTIHDASLAPAGQHVLSAVVQYAPADIAGGWDARRRDFLATCMATLATYAPGLREQVLHAELLTPADIEARTGATGGHWHQGELALDQYLMLRPVPFAAQYRAPVPGLWLASAGTHPGGGVLGTAGRLAAAQILGPEPVA